MSAGRNNIITKKDWNTPPKYIEPITKFLGHIELDPCSNMYSMVKANTSLMLPQNGLHHDWNMYKTIFINPPYGRNEDGTTIRVCFN